MHARDYIHETLEKILPLMHGKRRRTLELILGSIIFSKAFLTAALLGRGIAGAVKDKHYIKLVDRFLSNTILHRELPSIYRWFAHWVIGEARRIVILVDWSDLDPRNSTSVLRASLCFDGRPVTLYEEVHGDKKDKTRTIQKKFLRKLKEILPAHCKPIIVTDAGFKTPWFRDVEKLGWDYVGRVQKNTSYKKNGEVKLCEELHHRGMKEPKDYGEILLTAKKHSCRLVVFQETKKHRVDKNSRGERKRSSHSKKYAKRGKEAWVLVTSLRKPSPKRIIAYYSARMQIEEAFRDLKSTRHGLGLELSGTKQRRRYSVLVLLASLASLFAILLGKATELAKGHLAFQANTVTKRRVLSLMKLGLLAARKTGCLFTLTLLEAALRAIQVKSTRPLTVEAYQ